MPLNFADEDRYPPWAKKMAVFLGGMLVGTAAAVAMVTVQNPGSLYDQLTSGEMSGGRGGPDGHTADLPMGIPDASKGVATDDWRSTASPTGAPSPKTMTTRGPYVAQHVAHTNALAARY